MKKPMYVAALAVCMVGGWGVAAALTGSVPRANTPESSSIDALGTGGVSNVADTNSSVAPAAAGFAVTGEDSTDQCGVHFTISDAIEVAVTVDVKSELLVQFAADGRTQEKTAVTESAGIGAVSFDLPGAPSFAWRVQCVDPGTGAQIVRTGTGVDSSKL